MFSHAGHDLSLRARTVRHGTQGYSTLTDEHAPRHSNPLQLADPHGASCLVAGPPPARSSSLPLMRPTPLALRQRPTPLRQLPPRFHRASPRRKNVVKNHHSPTTPPVKSVKCAKPPVKTTA